MAALFGGSKKAAAAAFPATSASYVAKQYQAPAPAPLQAVTQPLPRERQAQAELERKQKLAAKEQQYDAKKKQQASKGGLFGKVAAAAVTAVATVDTVANKGYDAATETYYEKTDEASLQRFRAVGYPFEEKLQADFHCSVVCGDRFATGYLMISTWYLTFEGKIKGLYTETQEDLPVRIVVPLTDIASIRFGVSKKDPEKGRPATITMNADDSVPGETPAGAAAGAAGAAAAATYADSVLFFTQQHQMQLEFYDFKHYQIDYFQDMVIYADHFWRKAHAAAAAAAQPH